MLSLLRRLRLYSPMGWFYLLQAVVKHGINVLALLAFAQSNYSNRTALRDDSRELTYKQLYKEAIMLADWLRTEYIIEPGKKLAVICRNDSILVETVFAVSGLGADLYFLNPDMSFSQIETMVFQHKFDCIIYDSAYGEQLKKYQQQAEHKFTLLDCSDILTVGMKQQEVQNNNVKKTDRIRFERRSMGRLILLTGGTGGTVKTASHKPSLRQYISPFLSISTRLKLSNYERAYIATPIFHGYGLALLLLWTALGGEMIVRRKFDAQATCTLIRQYQIEVLSVVPLMVRRILNIASEAGRMDDLRTVQCVASGGAELDAALFEQVNYLWGEVLFNLYGTSEGGLQTIADPQQLLESFQKSGNLTIGQKIWGLKLYPYRLPQLEKCRPLEQGELGIEWHTGKLLQRSKRVVQLSGDMGWMDEAGYFYLNGRTDEMIISGGENVHPLAVEQILLAHPQILEAAAAGIKDKQYGQRLAVWAVRREQSDIVDSEEQVQEADLFIWLKTRVARYQMPLSIIFVAELPYTATGKLDRGMIKTWAERLNKAMD